MEIVLYRLPYNTVDSQIKQSLGDYIIKEFWCAIAQSAICYFSVHSHGHDYIDDAAAIGHYESVVSRADVF